MLKPRRFSHEVDPGPVQIQARKVEFDVAAAPLHWIPEHPAASHLVGLLNIVFPSAERWFVATFNEALPLVRDPKLAEDMRGFIGQESMHADVHERVMHEYMMARGVDPGPMLAQIEYVFDRMLAPTTSTDPTERFNHVCDRLWLIAAIEHYTAVLGDFALNCTWDDHDADPAIVDLFRWHASEEVEHRNVAHDVAVYFCDSYTDRIRSMAVVAPLLYVFFQRGLWYLTRTDPSVRAGWWRTQLMRCRDTRLGLLPKYYQVFGATTLTYFRPGFSPEEVGSTAQAVAYLASSPAARAAHR